jgi:hypothetical protein
MHFQIISPSSRVVLQRGTVSFSHNKKLEDHPFSVVSDRLFSIFAATLYISRPSPAGFEESPCCGEKVEIDFREDKIQWLTRL